MTIDPDALPIELDDAEIVTLTCQAVAAEGHRSLHLYVDEQFLGEHSEVVINRLRTRDAFELRVPDFEQDGRRFRTTVLTVNADGSMTPWIRTEDGCVSPPVHAPSEAGGPVSVDEPVCMPEPGPRELSYVVLATDPASGEVFGNHYPVVRIPPMLSSKN